MLVTVTFEPMPAEEFDAFLQRIIDSYAGELSRVDAEPPDVAQEKAADEIGRLLPRGVDSDNHTLCRIVSDVSEGVGVIWYGPHRMKDRSALFLYDLAIDPEHRRRGYASAAIERLCEEGRIAGIDAVALHVFDDNTAAISLYGRHGFDV